MATPLYRPAGSDPSSPALAGELAAPSLTPGLFAPGADPAAPPTSFFGGFEPWLNFRARAALERAVGSFSGRSARLVRALPIEIDANGDGLWALCDGERPPLAFLNGGEEGSRWARAGRSSLRGECHQDAYGDRVYPDEDALVAQLDYRIQWGAAAYDGAPFELLLEASAPLRHPHFYDPPARFDFDTPEEGQTPSEIESHPESLESAWARLLSEGPGEASLIPRWRELMGERRISLNLRARPLTTLSAGDRDPEWEGESNLWGQSMRDDISYWLVEADGFSPFLLERHVSESPYHQLDEVSRSESIQAKGLHLWGASSDMNNASEDPPNFFSRLLDSLPTPEGWGFDFPPGRAIDLDHKEVFEADLSDLFEVLNSESHPDQSGARGALLAAAEAIALSESCAPPSLAARPKPSPL